MITTILLIIEKLLSGFSQMMTSRERDKDRKAGSDETKVIAMEEVMDRVARARAIRNKRMLSKRDEGDQ